MPATTRSHTRGPQRAPIKLLPATPEDLRSYLSSNNLAGEDLYDVSKPLSIEQPWSYSFQRGENVWIKLCGKWYPGRIWGHKILKGLTQDKRDHCMYFCVYFWNKARKFVSPMNGDVKPDTPHTRKLLKEAGWAT
ncbi:hypothetical protein FIBSPDRAFT_946016 [Athelia psychrophila]|uniref:Uncharacterized protein n=1 Tax=Athelia psychrophila TaxID=1759441 RepID=A0A166T7N5_9AGAM|nr:hypothetical protein FIBSPDRAFT_946016 [Fibularhizoctonia sp. CBS 109695]